jgi:UMF1 family MFS transporter
VGFFAANSLYDAMLIDVADPAAFDRVSAFGYGLGYLGGALLFTVSVVLLARPAAFGLESPTAAIQLTFVLVGAWWALFSLPLLLWVRERHGGRAPVAVAFRAGLRQLRGTVRTLRGDHNLLWFLGAYWLYIDGVYTIIKMAVDYGLSQGLSAADVTGAILLTNFLGFPAAIAFGVLGTRIGPRRAIYLALAVYIVATAMAVFLTTAPQFYGLAAAIGLVQGGVQSLSRSLYARLIPPEMSGEYFGFFNMLGKFSSILGPVIAGAVALASGSQRVGILSIIVLFVAGLVMLTRVRVPAAGGGS